MEKSIKINTADNVAVALDYLKAGETWQGVTLRDEVKRGHKFSLRDIPQNAKVIKYGYPIGHATVDIKAGEWVHSHNLATDLEDGEGKISERIKSNASNALVDENATWMGYERMNGDCGIRNELWIIPTVGCVNSQANEIAKHLKECELSKFADDICAFTHNYGCSQLGNDHANTRRALAALATHPNAGGVIVLGLGCENNQISQLKEEIGEHDASRVRFIVAQEVDDEVAEGVRQGEELLQLMSHDKRTQQPVSKLKVGMKCGGSDGFSGITANPLVGKLTDCLTDCGGSAVLTEVPEMFGAEHVLRARCADDVIARIFDDMINDFKDYFRSHGQLVGENPSPGNKEGGITTLEEKSLGCVQKGGAATVVDVLNYAQKLRSSGLSVIWAPGNDLVASTALALSGCQIVLFTTGRGTPFGTCVPTMKISTNSDLYERKNKWIDFDAGVLVTGKSPDIVLNELKDEVLAMASGKKTKNELSHSKEIAIFKSGVTL